MTDLDQKVREIIASVFIDEPHRPRLSPDEQATLTAILDEYDRRGAALVEAEGALMAAQSFIADGGNAETDPGASIYRQITAALSPEAGK